MARPKRDPLDVEIVPQRERFIEEYLIDQNGTRAAVRAGYSADTAAQAASRMLAQPNVQAELQRRFDQRKAEYKARCQRIADEIFELACDTADMRPLEKKAALELAAKFYGLLNDKVEHTHFNGGDAKIEATATAQAAIEVYATLLQ